MAHTKKKWKSNAEAEADKRSGLTSNCAASRTNIESTVLTIQINPTAYVDWRSHTML